MTSLFGVSERLVTQAQEAYESKDLTLLRHSPRVRSCYIPLILERAQTDNAYMYGSHLSMHRSKLQGFLTAQ